MPPTPPTAPTQLDLYRIGKGWLPSFLFAEDDELAGEVRESLWGAAAVWARVARRVDELFQSTLIQLSHGIFLDQHLKDRGLAPQGPSEPEPAAQLRARTIADADSPVAILAVANGLLAAAGVVGTAVLIELGNARAFCQVDTTPWHVAYAGRGHRCGPSRPPRYNILVLPYGTSQALASAISAAVLKVRAGGYPHLIEVRRIP